MSDSSLATVREEISTAFCILADAIDRLQLHLNESGAYAIHQSSYEHALGIIEAEEVIMDIKRRLDAIEHDWNSANMELESSFSENTQEPSADSGKTIDREMAESFLKDPRNVKLACATMISEEAARILSQYEGIFLNLAGLQTISASAARSLAEFNGCLFFWDLKGVSGEVATGLASHTGGLVFSCNTDIPSTAQMILIRPHGSLTFSGVDRLTDEIARAFVDHCGNLKLGNDTIVSEEALVFLHASDGGIADGHHYFKTISVQTAERLVQTEDILNLSTLTILTPDAARILGQFKGELWLDRLPSISDEVATGLSKHVGYLNLDGVERLSDHAALALSKHDGEIWMHSLTGVTGAGRAAILQHGGIKTRYPL